MKDVTRSGHVSDETLLLLQECVVNSRESRRIHAHLRTCAACRARGAMLVRADAELRALSGNVEPVRTQQREFLQSKLAEEAARHAAPAAHRARRVFEPRILLRFALAGALGIAIVMLRHADPPGSLSIRTYEDIGPRPDPRLTPGAVNRVPLTELCEESDSDLDPRLSPDKVKAVFRAYGVNTRAAAAYQVDYLINPQLGGNDALENLWPEPYSATVWNASAKDELERRLHAMVCKGEVTLADAQHDLASDWITAYRKYFHVPRPLKTVAFVDLPAALEH